MKTLMKIGLAIVALASFAGCSTSSQQGTKTATYSNISNVQSLVPFPDMRISSTQSPIAPMSGQ